MTTTPPAPEVENRYDAPQRFRSVRHAALHNRVRGVLITHGEPPHTTDLFMDYEQAVRLYEALGAALAFLDDGGSPPAAPPAANAALLKAAAVVVACREGGTEADGYEMGTAIEDLKEAVKAATNTNGARR